jgi:Carboxypeptidase regulatory-like domain
MKMLFIVLLVMLIIPNMTFAVSVQGRITQKGTNNPATRALIVFILNGAEKARTITGDDGIYFIRDIPEGAYVVKISYRGVDRQYSGIVVGPVASTRDFGI